MGRGSCVDVRLGFFCNLSSPCLISYPVVREQQYEIIIIPTILVGIFLILLAVILWLFIRGQRAQQQSPGLRGKTQTGAGRRAREDGDYKKEDPSLSKPKSRR